MPEKDVDWNGDNTLCFLTCITAMGVLHGELLDWLWVNRLRSNHKFLALLLIDLTLAPSSVKLFLWSEGVYCTQMKS